MRCYRWVSFVALLAAPLCSQECRAQEPLRLKATSGPVKLVIEHDQKSATPDGQEQGSKHEIITLSVALEAAGEDLKLTFAMERLRLEEKRGERTKKVDTASEEGKKRPEAQMIGKQIVARVTPRGELRELISFGGKPFSEVPPEQQDQMKEMLYDNMVGNTALGLLVPYPEAGLAVGGTWQTELSARLPMQELAVKVENKVEAADEATVTVAQKGAMKEGGENGAGLDLAMESKLVVSRADGLIKEGEMSSRMSATQGGQGMVMTSTYKRRRATAEDEK